MNSPIELASETQRLAISPIGGGIMQYYVLDESGKRVDIIYGYENDEQKAGSMGDVLFPFPGRVENAEYEFEGKKYKLSGLRIKDGHANHGFAKWALWNIENQTDSSATLSFFIDPAEYTEKGYPFALKITLTYSLDDNGLTCQAKVENLGKETAPFGLGFHPYLTVGTDIVDKAKLHIQAGKLVEYAPNLKPTGKFLNIPAELDFTQPRQIGDIAIDNCYTDLRYDAGICSTEFSSDNQKIIIWQDQNLPFLQIYSADTIGEAYARKGLAIEAQTCTGFALNMPEMGLEVLKPNQVFHASWGINPS